MKAVPKLAISRELYEAETHDPGRTYSFRYRSRNHGQLPHVVKFSGGRSSGLLLFTLLENGFLDPERGDVVVFNNTSCEHPETYRFVSDCKARVESAGVPFFMVQYQTYEDARQGEWRRLPSYRLVNDRPFAEDNPDGFHWRGEVFEEMISSKAYLPNQFSRVCTHSLKLETTAPVPKGLVRQQEEHPSPGTRTRGNPCWTRTRCTDNTSVPGAPYPRKSLWRKGVTC